MVVRPGAEEAFEPENVFGLQGPVFPLTLPLGLQILSHHGGGHGADLLQHGGPLLAALGERGHAEAHIVSHAAQTEEEVDPLAQAHLKAPLVPLREGHIHRLADRRQKLDVHLVGQGQGDQARGVGQRRQSVEEGVPGLHVEFALLRAGGQQHTGEHVVFIGLEHTLGVGSHLDRVLSALPGGLNPDNGLVGQHVLPLQQKHVRVILVGGQRDDLPELLNIPRHPAL